MSIINYVQETSESIPYARYFNFFPCEKWALRHYLTLIIDNYKFAEKRESYRIFFNTLQHISNDLSISQEIRNVALTLIKNKKVSVLQINLN